MSEQREAVEERDEFCVATKTRSWVWPVTTEERARDFIGRVSQSDLILLRRRVVVGEWVEVES